jgi:hypothetical protein
VEAGPGRVAIADRFEGGAGQTCASRLLLHPDCAVQLEGMSARLRSGAVEVELASSLPLAAEPAEWYPDLYVSRPTTRLSAAFPAGGPGLRLELRRVAG